jgi:hypothetical protein
VKYRFEFHGGFRDGEVVAGDAIYLSLTDGGRIGARFFDNRPPTIQENEAWNKVLAGIPRPEAVAFNPKSPWDLFQHRSFLQQYREEIERLFEHRYEYEVTRREERDDVTIVRLDCISSPDSG